MMQGGGRFIAPTGLSGAVGQRFFQPPRRQQTAGVNPQLLQIIRSAFEAQQAGHQGPDVGDRQVGAPRPHPIAPATATPFQGSYDVGGQQTTPPTAAQPAPQSRIFRSYLAAQQKPQFSIGQLLPLLAALNTQR